VAREQVVQARARPADDDLPSAVDVGHPHAVESVERCTRAFVTAIKATIDPSVAAAARAIAAPRTPMSRAPSSMESSPEATRALNSPRL